MSSYQTVKRIQNNETKQRVREIIDNVIVDFAKQNKTPVTLLSLPSTEWAFEKGSKNGIGLNECCKKNKIKVKFIGVENSSQQKIVNAFKKNAPKNAIAIRGEFDNIVKQSFSGDLTRCNVIYADYCGNPAKATFYNPETENYRYTYPHILLLRDVVEKAKKPTLYLMTFSCNGRIKGGAEAMQKALSPNSNSVHTAIKHKIAQTLCTYHLTHKAKIIMSVYYHGAGKSFMVTIGVAINYNPKTTTIKENWVKPTKTAKEKYKHVKIDYIGIKKEAMKALSDLGWDNTKIAHALNTQVSKVRGVISWHEHRSSWKKIKLVA
jgi:hypothetical protein